MDDLEGLAKRCFDSKAFALQVRIAMAEENLSLRKLGAKINLDQVTLHRVAAKELEPSISTYFRLKAWLDDLAALRAQEREKGR